MSAPSNCRGFAREVRDATKNSQASKALRNHRIAPSNSLQRRGFAREDRDTAKTSQTSKAPSKPPQSFEPLTAPRNHLHIRGLRKQSPYVLLLLLFSLSLHAAEDIVVRTNISPESVWVGQRMTLQIDVLGKDGWAQISDIDAVEIPNCYLLPSGNSRVRLQERIEGADYSGQRYELSLYPQRDGSIEIPALSLPVKIQTWGAGAGTNEQVVTTEPRSIEAKLPAGVQNVHSFVASSKFTATQTWSSDASDFKVGDALKRSIQLRADNLPAMLLPTIAYPDIEYLSNYPETPELSDTTERSTPLGLRNESITYLFEANGTAQLPDYSFQWWDTQTETLTTVTLEGRQIQISGGMTHHAHSNEASSTAHWKWSIVILFCIVVTIVIVRRAQTQRNSNTERTLFNQLLKQAQNGNVSAILNASFLWLESLPTQPRQLSLFFKTHADKNTATLAEAWIRDPGSSISPDQRRKLVKALRHARKQALVITRQFDHLSKAQKCLPQLNE
ncbi:MULTISPECIES: BatD family protein [unclassified Lentimonas]|uniref:BatD family protein n=1 Tax=unclassified Lentimonas TaxID=2630993 RepID=UPI0013230040|nr:MULTISPECIES: BatD family protein [unclassified Lentimonas]CAA6678204.1 Unannotated [Lentimonas sp. CC4]CAA6686593.1 Unannotated [Lentimonas sp. CC6]CAA7074869.1 Unannotated [Lentimonas sp. CC4]CAA7169495.1 Unannotated [Lentimonas sp. CC21]CAA7179767.1 Unannotated [Lentimonas sp. CC8]